MDINQGNNNEGPLVSVIMPMFNAFKYLREAVDSILNQTYSNFELLIMDDCSTDNSCEIINSYRDSRIVLFKNIENQGYLRTCNSLFSKCSGKLITFQDADDISELTRIEKQVKSLQENENVAICFTDCSVIDSFGRLMDKREETVDLVRYKTDADYWPLICYNSIMIKKEVLNEVGGYNLFYDRLGYEDFEWFFRILCKFECIHLNENLFSYRLHQSAVKLYNVNLKKYISYDVFRYYRQMYISQGIDVFEEKYKILLDAKVEELYAPFRTDDSLPFRIESIVKLNEKRYIESLKLCFNAINKSWFRIRNYSHIIYITYLIIRRKVGI